MQRTLDKANKEGMGLQRVQDDGQLWTRQLLDFEGAIDGKTPSTFSLQAWTVHPVARAIAQHASQARPPTCGTSLASLHCARRILIQNYRLLADYSVYLPNAAQTSANI